MCCIRCGIVPYERDSLVKCESCSYYCCDIHCTIKIKLYGASKKYSTNCHCIYCILKNRGTTTRKHPFFEGETISDHITDDHLVVVKPDDDYWYAKQT
eukprot:UN04732